MIPPKNPPRWDSLASRPTKHCFTRPRILATKSKWPRLLQLIHQGPVTKEDAITTNRMVDPPAKTTAITTPVATKATTTARIPIGAKIMEVIIIPPVMVTTKTLAITPTKTTTLTQVSALQYERRPDTYFSIGKYSSVGFPGYHRRKTKTGPEIG